MQSFCEGTFDVDFQEKSAVTDFSIQALAEALGITVAVGSHFGKEPIGKEQAEQRGLAWGTACVGLIYRANHYVYAFNDVPC